MYVLIVIDARKQEFGLGAAVYYALDEKGWKSSPAIPFTFWKEFKELSDPEDLKAAIQDDVSFAAVEAEWAKFDYLYVACNSAPALAKALLQSATETEKTGKTR
jgi:hypothetical protein